MVHVPVHAPQTARFGCERGVPTGRNQERDGAGGTPDVLFVFVWALAACSPASNFQTSFDIRCSMLDARSAWPGTRPALCRAHLESQSAHRGLAHVPGRASHRHPRPSSRRTPCGGHAPLCARDVGGQGGGVPRCAGNASMCMGAGARAGGDCL